MKNMKNGQTFTFFFQSWEEGGISVKRVVGIKGLEGVVYRMVNRKRIASLRRI
jgi:hypothetical protein